MFDHVGLSLGAGARYPTVTLDFESAQARLTRVPFDLSLRGGWRTGRVELSAEVGFGAAVMIIEGQSLTYTERSIRADLSVRIAAQVRLWVVPRLALYLSVLNSVSPAQTDLTVDRLGRVGSTPEWWIGSALGLAIRMK